LIDHPATRYRSKYGLPGELGTARSREDKESHRRKDCALDENKRVEDTDADQHFLQDFAGLASSLPNSLALAEIGVLSQAREGRKT